MVDNYDEIPNKQDPTERPYPDVLQPDREPDPAWSTNQRRAYILDLYTYSKDFSDINKKELGEEFGVTRQTIHTDCKIVKEWHKKHKGFDFEAEANKTYKWGLQKAKEEDNLKEVRKYIESYGDWLYEEGERDKEPEQVEVVGGDLDILHGGVDESEKDE